MLLISVFPDPTASESLPSQDGLGPWLEKLRNSDPKVRCEALERLATMGADTERTVPAVLECLKDPDWVVREKADEVLDRIVPGVEEAVPLLIEKLSDPCWFARQAAAEALGIIGPGAKEAVPRLIEKFRQDNEIVRMRAAEALARIGKPAIPALIRILENVYGFSRDRELSVWSLGQMGPEASQAAPALLQALIRDENDLVRQAAAEALTKIRGISEAEVNKAQQDSEICFRSRSDAKKPPLKIDKMAVPTLIEKLTTRDYSEVESVAEALVKLGLNGSQAAPALLEALRYYRKHSFGVSKIASGFFKMGKDAVPILLDGLKDRELRVLIILILGEMGKDAVDAAPSLLPFLDLEDPIPETFPAVPEVLRRPPISNVRGEPDPMVRMIVAETLGKMGSSAQVAVPALISRLNDRNAEVRKAALEALYKIGSPIQKIVAPVIQCVNDADANVRWKAVEVLGKMGPRAKAAESALVQKLKDPDEYVRWEAQHALHMMRKNEAPQ